jgi:dTMP kinase
MVTQVNSDRAGRFITLEGSEGVGKTSNLEVVADCICRAGFEVCATREPGGTDLGEQIRKLVLDSADAVAPPAELLLVFAARAQHLEEVIRPALAAGKWVLSDRFTDASYAYQGGGRGIDLSAIEALENFVQGSLRPDLTFYLDIEPGLGFERIKNRPLDRLERERADFYQRVRSVYLARAQQAPDRYVIVDASPALARVANAVRAGFAQHLPRLLRS